MDKTLQRVNVDPRHLNRRQVEMVVELAWKSFAAVPEDKADWKPAPTAKSAHDLLRHAVEVNHRVAGDCAGRELTEAEMKRIERSTATYAGAARQRRGVVSRPCRSHSRTSRRGDGKRPAPGRHPAHDDGRARPPDLPLGPSVFAPDALGRRGGPLPQIERGTRAKANAVPHTAIVETRDLDALPAAAPDPNNKS